MTSSHVPAFSFEGRNLRVVKIDGEPWFSASDVCRCLGLDMVGGPSRHLGRLDDDEKIVARKGVLNNIVDPRLLPLFGKYDSTVTAVSRPAVLKMISRSNKPEAKRFDRWVRHEVLPSIMDTGSYAMPGAQPAQGSLPASADRLQALVENLVAQNGLLVENIGKLIGLLGGHSETEESSPVPEAHDDLRAFPQGFSDKEFFTARETLLRMGLGEEPHTQEDFKRRSQGAGISMSTMSRKANAPVRTVMDPLGRPKNLYHRAIVQAYADKHAKKTKKKAA